jgi:hypothetical protein
LSDRWPEFLFVLFFARFGLIVMRAQPEVLRVRRTDTPRGILVDAFLAPDLSTEEHKSICATCCGSNPRAMKPMRTRTPA